MAGIPFMLTTAIKDALRGRGLTDVEIEQITPAEAQKILLTPDTRAVREFVTAIATQAKAALAASADPGLLQITRLHPTSENLVPSRFALDDIEHMISTAMGDSEAGHNIYIEGRTVPTSLRGNIRGTLTDTVAVFALVIDSDADKDMGWTPTATIRPSMTVETSPGNFQFWFFLRAAINPELAQELGERIRHAVNSDHDTGNPTQPYRIAGTINYPNANKIARGRNTVWTRLIALDPAALWTPEDIERAFPASEQPKVNGGAAAAPASSVSESDIPADTMRVIRDGPKPSSSKRDRSLAFFNVMIALKRLGFTVEGILELLERYSEGIAKKYEGRLQQEVERAYNKISVGDDAGEPKTAIVPVSIPAPRPLDEVHKAFKKWLGKDYDSDVLDAVLAAAAAERLTGDPLWLLVISGPGNAKTETVQALAGAGALVTSTIASEGALLSATRSQGGQATGGLLRRLGNRGLLVIKDFTSILAADRNVRGSVLAAIREIYDGKWERNVGVSGGRTLTWIGRITIVAACTTAWDTAHSVIATMGDRFVIVRSNSRVGRVASALKAIQNTGQEGAMRAELAAAVGGLINNASKTEYQLSHTEVDRLVKLANIVTWTRTGIERDYKGDVIDAHAPEMPTRFVKQLTQLVRGAVAIGIPAARAMRLAGRCARDSMAPLRRDILLDLAAHPHSCPQDVHTRITRPRTTTQRELMGLHMLGLLECEEVEEKRGTRSYMVPYYSLAPELDRGTLLNM